LITHVDAQVDTEPLREFIASYESVSPLKLGELWAIPIMLRLALIEKFAKSHYTSDDGTRGAQSG
jgi:cyclic beta-1,2-glucan synthetase